MENELNPATQRIQRSWTIYFPSDDVIKNIQMEIDEIFIGYSFYPEVDWGQYGYRPPDGHEVHAAWRHPEKTVFAFLLDNPNMENIGPMKQLLLYVAGVSDEVEIIEDELISLKNAFSIDYRKAIKTTSEDERLDRIHKARSLVIITGILTIITTIINGYSLYLRELPPPEIDNQVIMETYFYFQILIHFGALILLLLVIFLVAAFIIRYGLLFVRRI